MLSQSSEIDTSKISKGCLYFFSGIRVSAETFEYPDTLVENVWSLIHEMKRNDKALALGQTTLIKVDVILVEANILFLEGEFYF